MTDIILILVFQAFWNSLELVSVDIRWCFFTDFQSLYLSIYREIITLFVNHRILICESFKDKKALNPEYELLLSLHKTKN